MSSFRCKSHTDLDQNVEKNKKIFHEIVISHLTRLLYLSKVQMDDLRSVPESPFKRRSKLSLKQDSVAQASANSLRQKESSVNLSLTNDHSQQMLQLIDFLSRKKNLTVEELFQKSGNTLRQKQLLTALNTGACINFDKSHFRVHDIANVLIEILDHLPEPLLLPSKHLDFHVQISKMSPSNLDEKGSSVNQERRIESLQLLLLLLPPNNRKVLRRLLTLLFQIPVYQESNKMTTADLADIFVCLLLFPSSNTATEVRSNVSVFDLKSHLIFMIKNVERIFTMPSYIQVADDLSDTSSKKSSRSSQSTDRDLRSNSLQSKPVETGLENRSKQKESLPKLQRNTSIFSSFRKKNKKFKSEKLYHKTKKPNDKRSASFNKHHWKKSLLAKNEHSYFRFAQPGDDALPHADIENKVADKPKKTTISGSSSSGSSITQETSESPDATINEPDFVIPSEIPLASHHRRVKPVKSSTPKPERKHSSDESDSFPKRTKRVVKVTTV